MSLRLLNHRYLSAIKIAVQPKIAARWFTINRSAEQRRAGGGQETLRRLRFRRGLGGAGR
jgi:hypothetical protein